MKQEKSICQNVKLRRSSRRRTGAQAINSIKQEELETKTRQKRSLRRQITRNPPSSEGNENNPNTSEGTYFK